MSDYYRDRLRTKEEELRIANDLIDLKDGWLRSLNEKLERLEEENKILTLQLKETREFFVDIKMENKQLKNKNIGLERALVQANKTIDFLSNENRER